MTTATGAREVPYSRREVWRALTALTPYCKVCDVSYVFVDADGPNSGGMGLGTRFVCVAGRLEHTAPPSTAPRGEVVGWAPERRISTRLELASETWDTDIELADAQSGRTRVAVTITLQRKRGSRLVHRLQERAIRRTVEQTVQSELEKLPAHLAPPAEDDSPSATTEQETDGLVLRLRGNVDVAAVARLELDRRLRDHAVVAIDVSELVYLDSTGLLPLVRWAREAAKAGRPAIVRGDNQAFDQLCDEMGLSSRLDRRR